MFLLTSSIFGSWFCCKHDRCPFILELINAYSLSVQLQHTAKKPQKPKRTRSQKQQRPIKAKKLRSWGNTKPQKPEKQQNPQKQKKKAASKKKGLKQMVLKLGNVRSMQLLVMVICCNGNGHLFPLVSKAQRLLHFFDKARRPSWVAKTGLCASHGRKGVTRPDYLLHKFSKNMKPK